MKKYFIIPLALILCISLSGCFGPFAAKKEPVEVSSEPVSSESAADAPAIDKVSKPETVEVPNVEGVEEESAVDIITSKGLIPTVQYLEHNVIEKGKVIKTEPAKNTVVNPESLVTIYVSKGLSGLNKTISCYDSGIMLGEITFKPDFNFTLTVNLYEGFGEVTGTYKLGSDKSVMCSVSDRNFMGFSGDDIDSFTFYPLADGSYRLKINDGDYLGALMQNYIFK